MKNKLLSALLGLAISASAPLMAQTEPMLSTYQSIPFWLDGQTIPHVMLVLERDWKMFYPAYNNLADLDGDGALDIGFNPKVTYVGYFDSNSCYTYDSGKGMFIRAGAATPQTEQEAAALAPQVIRESNMKYPASAHGVCRVSGSGDKGTGQWHGNWLNHAMTSRMDAIRKVLYGGKREIDSMTETVLEMIYVPGNAHVWGGELYADDIWEQYSPSSVWYDIASFTGFPRPGNGKMHFWARANVYWTSPLASPTTAIPTAAEQQARTKSAVPLFRFVANIPSTNLHPSLKTPVRIWDWVGDHSSYGSLPADGNLAKSKSPAGVLNTYPESGNADAFMVSRTQLAYNFSARVKVCEKGNISPTEGCQAYGTDSYKPIGLLQEYGESERMFFGLLTGSLQYDQVDSYRPASKRDRSGGTRYRGGVVRHHIQTFDKNIYPNTGQIKRVAASGNPSESTLYGYADTSASFKRDGIIATIDALEITGLTASYDAYGDGTQAGNPLGEMLWEALRYLVGTGTAPGAAGSAYTSAGGLNPNSMFVPASETKVRDHKKTLISLPLLKSWDSRPSLGENALDCPKPVILVISEVFPDHDDDNYPNLSDFANVPLLSGLSESTLPRLFDMDEYLNKITTHELGEAINDGREFFFPDSRGLCTAKKMTDGLKGILGHCPSEPSLEGTYNLAALAYYAHTHNFGPLAGVNDIERSVDIYAVGIAGNFPDITLAVDDKRSVAIMPITLASLLVNTSYPEGEIDQELKTLLNFFIEYWMADDNKVPYKVKFSTNFEFTTTPCFTYNGNSNNWERDIFNTFTISLLTTKDTPAAYREAEPLFINSGPYKTNRDLYLSDRSSGNFNSQTYYYAFKRPQGGSLDIIGSGFNVAGLAVHSDTFGSGYGSGGMAGYTITGVTFPGAYIDVGLYRADYPLFYTNQSSFQPGASTVDEPVPLDPSGTGIPGAKWNFAGGVMHSGTHYTSNAADCHYYHPPTLRDVLLTPAECPYYGYTDSDPAFASDPDMVAAYNPRPSAARVCGKNAAGYYPSLGNFPTSNTYERYLFQTSLMRYVQVRSFKFNLSDAIKDKPTKLRNPMWLAAKYGGFKDHNGNGIPDLESEWIRGGSGVGASDPYNYFGVANMSELPKQLGDAFEAIANSVATGTANSSSVSMVLGGGLSVQTQYRTEYQASEDVSRKIKWAGTSYAFFMDKWGNLRADTNGNGKLDLITSPKSSEWSQFYPGKTPPTPYEIGDLIVHTVAPSGKGLPLVYLCRDPYGDNNGGLDLPSDPGHTPEAAAAANPTDPDAPPPYPPHSHCEPIGSLDAVKAFWNSAKNISDMDVDKRRLFSYYGDEKSDGMNAWTAGGVSVSDYPFKADDSDNISRLHVFMGQDSTANTANLIRYIRGEDFPDKYRSRTVRLPWDALGAAPKVWRMGDVINSKPVLAGQPSSGFHQIYGDQSYAEYRNAMATRRQVSYFGSNDGILHAINLGFFGALANGQAGYFKDPVDGGPAPGSDYEIGDEIWGYLPPSVLAHLQWLADEAYGRSYYVDLSPQIVDVKDTNRTGVDQWRTVMIVGLRLGGAPIELANGGPEHPFTSSEFFAMDITDPESPPKLLWRFSDPRLGQSTALPTVVRSGHNDRWYIVLPSGPVQFDDASGLPLFSYAQELYAGRSNQRARVIVLDALTGEYARHRDKNPGSYLDGDPLMVEEQNSFFNDTFTPRAMNAEEVNGVVKWGHHVVYLGLSSKNADNYDSGAVYRLKMVDDNGNAVSPDGWQLVRFYKTDKPVTAAVNSTYDTVGNLWVLFGTGRVWSRDDMTPCGVTSPTAACATCYEQYLFGIKEPLDANLMMTFGEVPQDVDIIDVSGVKVYENGAIDPPVTVSGVSKTTFESLYNYMLSKTGNVPNAQGYKVKLETWKKDLANYKKTGTSVAGKDIYEWRNPDATTFELVNTQVQLDALSNGRVNAVVTSYVPSSNICEPLGESYLMLFDAFVGLPAPYMASYGRAIVGETKEVDGGGGAAMSKQVTAVKRVGDGMASQAWVLKTGGGVTYGATGFAGQRVVFRDISPQAINSRFISWREVLNLNLDMQSGTSIMFQDVKDQDGK